MKIPLLNLPYSWLPALRWLLKPILRPICRNFVHGTHQKTVRFGAGPEGIIFEDVDWMGVTVFKTIPWEYVDQLVLGIDEARAWKKGGGK